MSQRHELLEALHVIQYKVGQVQQESVAPQQETFVNHISATTERLIELIEETPSHETFFPQIFVTLFSQFQQALPSIYGYAKLLQESPASFDEGENLSNSQRKTLGELYEIGIYLTQLTQTISKSAIQNRIQESKQGKQTYNLNQVIEDNLEFYRYWIRETDFRVEVDLQEGIPLTEGFPYHTNELIRHVIQTIATELSEEGDKGTITLSTQFTLYSNHMVSLIFECETVVLDSIENSHTLFVKEGRKLYTERIRQIDAKVDFDTHRIRFRIPATI